MRKRAARDTLMQPPEYHPLPPQWSHRPAQNTKAKANELIVVKEKHLQKQEAESIVSMS